MDRQTALDTLLSASIEVFQAERKAKGDPEAEQVAAALRIEVDHHPTIVRAIEITRTPIIGED